LQSDAPKTEPDKAIEQAKKNVAHAERRGNFASAHHEVLKNLLEGAGKQPGKGKVENAEQII